MKHEWAVKIETIEISKTKDRQYRVIPNSTHCIYCGKKMEDDPLAHSIEEWHEECLKRKEK